MSHWKGYQTQDIFGNEADRVNHLLPTQDGEVAVESVTFNDSHKELRFEGAHVGRTSVCHDGSVTETALTKLDANFFPSSLREGSSNIPDPALPLISEKDASSLGNINCSTEGTNLNCKGEKNYTKSFREGENDTGKNTLCLDYGNTGDTHNKKVGVSSVDSFVGILTESQMSGEDDLLFSDFSNIDHFEDFEKMFRNHGSNIAHGSTITEDEISWFSSSSHGFYSVEDTLQSVVLSSVSTSSAFSNASSAHGIRSNALPATEPLVISTAFPSSTDCSFLPLYSVSERKGKSLLSELVYDLTGAEKSMTLEQIGYRNSPQNPIMINTTLKELSTTKGKKINPTYGATVQSSLSGCSLIQCDQDQELLSSFLPVPSPSSHAISKKTLVSESLASNCLHSYDPQARLSDILKSSIIKSSDCPDFVTPNNPLSDANHSMGLISGSFPMLPMPLEKNEEIYSCPHFPAAWVMDKPLEQHMDNALEHHVEASNSSAQRKYKFEGDKEPVVTITSSALQDSSCLPSTTCLDDVSIKAASFQQLQMIMDRLGIRTRLCIRDSLYRLARSAEQSHCYGSGNVSGATSPVRGFQSSKASMRPPEILGLSMSTNEIERAVAYLLFHKSWGSGTGSADDSMWLRTPLHMLGSASRRRQPYQPAS